MRSLGRVRFLGILFWLLLFVFALGVQLSSQEPKLGPSSQFVAPAIVTADSGVKSSGTGKIGATGINWELARRQTGIP